MIQVAPSAQGAVRVYRHRKSRIKLDAGSFAENAREAIFKRENALEWTSRYFRCPLLILRVLQDSIELLGVDFVDRD